MSTPLSDAMLEALAVLRIGPAERTTGRSVATDCHRRVNRLAVIALHRRGMADSAGKRMYQITAAGIEAYDERMGWR